MIKDMKLNDAASCRGGLLERPRYFPRQLITPGEMTLEQDYFRQKLRLHNRLLHGWGVVCGALVCLVPKKPRKAGEPPSYEPWLVRVQPGYALGPWGDDILIDCERTVDLRSPGTGGAPGEPAEQSRDPWCAEVHVPRDEGPLYVAIRYKEMPVRPVRVPPVGCGCDGTECEYSRWRDGYEIGILPECPASHQGPPPSFEDLFHGLNPPCPPCSAEPWVVLAEVTVGPGGAIEKIDNCSCRRLVASFGHFWWPCEPPPVQVIAVQVQGELPQGTKDAPAVVTGKGFAADMTASFGGKITVVPKEVKPERMDLLLTIAADAPLGERALQILDKDGAVLAEQPDVLKVVLAAQRAQPEQPPEAEKKEAAAKPAERKGKPAKPEK